MNRITKWCWKLRVFAIKRMRLIRKENVSLYRNRKLNLDVGGSSRNSINIRKILRYIRNLWNMSRKFLSWGRWSSINNIKWTSSSIMKINRKNYKTNSFRIANLMRISLKMRMIRNLIICFNRNLRKI